MWGLGFLFLEEKGLMKRRRSNGFIVGSQAKRERGGIDVDSEFSAHLSLIIIGAALFVLYAVSYSTNHDQPGR